MDLLETPENPGRDLTVASPQGQRVPREAAEEKARRPGPRHALYIEGQRVLVAPNPLERWLKLKALLAPSEQFPHGRSTNSVAVEVDIPLRTLSDFLKSGGAPAKFDPAAGDYTTEHLVRLAAWVDDQRDVRVRGARRHRPAVPLHPAAATGAAAAAATSNGDAEASESRTAYNEAASGSDGLSRFLASLGPPFLDYEVVLKDLGAGGAGGGSSVGTRLAGDASPGASAHAAAAQAVGGLPFERLLDAGVRKLHARRLLDAAAQLQAAAAPSSAHGDPGRAGGPRAESSSRGRGSSLDRRKPTPLPIASTGAGRDRSGKNSGSGESVAAAGARAATLVALLAEAERMGLSGDDLEAARAAVNTAMLVPGGANEHYGSTLPAAGGKSPVEGLKPGQKSQVVSEATSAGGASAESSRNRRGGASTGPSASARSQQPSHGRRVRLQPPTSPVNTSTKKKK